MEIGVITNPNSRKNQRKPNRVGDLQNIVGQLGLVHQTRDTEAIKPVLRQFLRERARFWVSDGGDGALHWMLRMGMDVLEEDEFRGQGLTLPLALPTNGGSIDFVAHNVGLRGNAETLLSALRRTLEEGQTIEEAEVDSMLVTGIRINDAGQEEAFRTLGFASAAGGIGQRFFERLFEEGEHTTKNIVSIMAKTVSSAPVALSPLRNVPGMPGLLRHYATKMFKPTSVRLSLDGQVQPYTDCSAINIASMAINLGNVFRLFGQADVPGQLHAIVGTPTPATIIRNIPRLTTGRPLQGKNIYDGACTEMSMEALGDELMGPIIDGEYYPNVKKISFAPGPRLRIPRVRPLPIDTFRRWN